MNPNRPGRNVKEGLSLNHNENDENREKKDGCC
jgi:hypothetical protein